MRTSSVSLLLASSILVLGCNQGFEGQLQACGIVSDGELTTPLFYAPNECYEQCLAEASCGALEDAFCRSDLSLLLACDQRCAFRCDDGTLLPVEQVCDGWEACEGGEDEVGCEPYRCADGQELPGRGHECNGWTECRDGSDEAGCPEWECGDGEVLPYRERCNGWSRCRDASDEEGCAELLLRCGDR